MHALSSPGVTPLDPPRRLTEQDYERLDHLLGKHFATLTLEILKLVAFSWGMALIFVLLAWPLVLSALR